LHEYSYTSLQKYCLIMITSLSYTTLECYIIYFYAHIIFLKSEGKNLHSETSGLQALGKGIKDYLSLISGINSCIKMLQ
jgi:hypothetical protein